MPSALMIHPGECNRVERMVARTGRPVEHTPRTLRALGPSASRVVMASGGSASNVEISQYGRRPGEGFIRVGSAAVLLIDGPIWYDHSGMGCWWGGMSTIDLANTCMDILADDTITGVVCDLDSPGGMVAGINDLTTALSALRDAKPLVMFVHEMGCSLAYWMACYGHRVYGTPSSITGAIGAMAVHYDTSGATEKNGERAVLITSDAPIKGMGHWGVPISESMIAAEQDTINAMGSMFRAAVTQHRGIPEESLLAMAGAAYFGQSQVDHGLVDELITTAAFYDRVLDGTIFDGIMTPASVEISKTPAGSAASRSSSALAASSASSASSLAHTPTPVAAARATHERTAMDDTLKAQLAELTEDEKKEARAILGDEESTEEETEEEKAAKAAAESTDPKEDEPAAMTLTQAKAFLKANDITDVNLVNALAIQAVELKMDKVDLLQSVIKAQRNAGGEIAQTAQGGTTPIGGHRGQGGGGGGGGDAAARYHAAVKAAMTTYDIPRHNAVARVAREDPGLSEAYVAQCNVGRVG